MYLLTLIFRYDILITHVKQGWELDVLFLSLGLQQIYSFVTK
jgi:hypothetical protein